MTDTRQIQRSPVATAAGVDAATRFLERLLPPPRDFDVRVGDEILLHADDRGSPRFTLVVASRGALRRAFRPPVERSLAAAFSSGNLDVEGDLVGAYATVIGTSRRVARSPRQVLALVRAWRRIPRDGAATTAAAPPRAAPLTGRRHSTQRDRDAVRHHYDLGNDFYALFLDRRMVYSCGYFPTGHEELDRAQELKLELICRKLRLRPGERLLDIGCGWGALLIHAATHHDVTGLGITLSERQQALAQERVRAAGLAGRIEIRLADYRELGAGPDVFDKVASIGMFEHVGGSRLPEYFARVRAVLRPGGLFLNHGISRRADTRPRGRLREWLGEPLTRLFVGRSGLTRAVFPDSELVPVSEANAVAERMGWEVRDVESLREHYARTLRHWVARLEQRRAEAGALVGAATVRVWRIYFAASAHRFDSGVLNVHQSLLARPRSDGSVDLPPTRADLYG